MPLPRVIVGMPHYGDISAGAARSLFVGPTRGDTFEDLRAMDVSSSLLAHAFNCLLGFALDERDKGTATHFAMLHADVQPDYFWLDILAEEMARTKAELVSCVIPIKSPERDPETTTGIGTKSDPWAPIRKFRVSQRESMPETFGPRDCGCTADEFLAVNTGCWLADLRRPWWDDFSFNITSRICPPEPGRPRDIRTRSEDWEMARHLDAAGARVRATWKVGLQHHGVATWANR